MVTKVVLSSGHGKYVRGAAGILDEVDEARKSSSGWPPNWKAVA